MVKVWGKFLLKVLPLSWKPSRGMDGMYFKHFSTAVEGSSGLLCSHICELDSWMLRENYSLICGEPDWTAASPYTIQTLPLRLIKDRSFHFLQWLGREMIHGWSQLRLVDRSSQICRLAWGRGFLPKIPGVITGWTYSICITISVRLRLQSASHGESIRLHTSSSTYPSTLILSWITDVTQTSFLGEKEKKSPSPQRNCPAKRNQIPTKFHHFHHSTLLLEDLQTMVIITFM